MKMHNDRDSEQGLTRVLLTDCGSTTTKAVLLEDKGKGLRLSARGQAPTTVENPVEDVTVGVLNATREVEELSGRKLLDDSGKIIRPGRQDIGVDKYMSTSSAGGGLQMIVAGVVGSMTGESALRAALGAGAIVMELLAYDDKRSPHEKVELVRRLKPDMILLAGGTDGGTKSHVVEIAELLAAAAPRPRLGEGYSLPLIYAGNKDARREVESALKGVFEFKAVENLRPTLEEENLEPAREEIHRLFLDHVMAHAPGYNKLMKWTDGPLMPTPAAVGAMIQSYADKKKIGVLAVDIGGATTDIFSLVWTGEEREKPVYNRTVSANLGMSYSIGNVLDSVGLEEVLKWLPVEMDSKEALDKLGNKMIRPTTIPDHVTGLMLEQAVAREALSSSMAQHMEFARGLSGLKRTRTVAEAFRQKEGGAHLLNMSGIDLIIGSGGVLSNAPSRVQAAMMLIDAFQPAGITRLAVDSIFMLPHLGVLSSIDPGSAANVLEKDCLVNLGTCIAPIGRGRHGSHCLTAEIRFENGKVQALDIPFGSIKRLDLPSSSKAGIELEVSKGFFLGQGRERKISTRIRGGEVGLILDCRGRPLVLGSGDSSRRELVNGWAVETGLYDLVDN
ncbi:MAG: methylaspartate mutase [Deltaproteobacteria bacterium]|nr:methylaspartate mutase [Deltaproteobacteria bacterium]